MNMTGRIITGLAAVCLAGGLGGCGKAAEKATEVATEKAIEKSIAKDGGTADVKIDSQSGAMQMKGKDASGNAYEMKTGGDGNDFQFQQTAPDGTVTHIGAGAKLPADFPKDVPVIDGLALQTVQVSPEKKEYVAQGTVAVPVAKAGAFYREKVKAQGWKELTAMDGGDMQTLQYEKDERILSVMLMKEGDGTMVSLQTGAK